MAGTYTLYTYPNNPRAYKGLIAAKYAGINVDVPSFTMGTDNKTPEFLAKFPTGKVPALDTPDGPIFESNAIAKYFARVGNVLLSDDVYELSLIDQWIDFSATQIDPHVSAWLLPIYGIVPFDANVTERAKIELFKALDVLNRYLLKHTYLVGETVTLADIIVAMSLLNPYKILFDKVNRKPIPNVTRWFTTIIKQPNVLEIIGNVELCKEMQVAKQTIAKQTTKKEEKQKKEDIPEKEEKKKEVNPLDTLPPTSFSLHKFKDVYSNNDTRKEALPWLWENLDKEGFSFYHCDYKFNDTLTKSFFALNLIGGFYQSLGNFNKYCFASCCVFGSDNDLQVAGVFLVRGKDLPRELAEEGENFDWKPLNPDNEDDKKLIEDFFAWDGEFGGKYKKFNSGKVFK